MTTPKPTGKKPRGPRVDVTVTADIMNAASTIVASSSHCMIAEAIKAAHPAAKNIAVDISTCRFTDSDKGHRYVYLTPRVAQIALVEFDEGTMPAPFSFQLRGAHVTTVKRKAKGPKPPDADLLSKATIVGSPGRVNGVPRRVGGLPPPQLHLRREFGIRAFRGASANRLATQQQATAAAGDPHAE